MNVYRTSTDTKKKETFSKCHFHNAIQLYYILLVVRVTIFLVEYETVWRCCCLYASVIMFTLFIFFLIFRK